jgi:hypothetical protein
MDHFLLPPNQPTTPPGHHEKTRVTSQRGVKGAVQFDCGITVRHLEEKIYKMKQKKKTQIFIFFIKRTRTRCKGVLCT